MADVSREPVLNEEVAPILSESQRFRKILFSRWPVILGCVLILLVIIMAIFSPLLAPFDPNSQNLGAALEQPSAQHWLGTDQFGRDVLSRIIYGSRIAILVGIATVVIAGVAGVLLGLVAGYFEGWGGAVIMRFMDTLMSMPPMIITLAIAVMLGGGLLNLLIALAFGFIPTYCRLMYGQVLSTKENDYIMATRTLGANHLRLMLRHVLPNTFPAIIVMFTLDLGIAILVQASLGYLGIGIIPPTATWGAMIQDGQRYLLTNPLLSLIPGLFIALVVVGFNNVGDGLRDALDPRLRGRIQ